MVLLQKELKSGNEIELDLCLQDKCVALPFFISWFKYDEKDGLSSILIDIHFLCFSLHFEYSNWKKKWTNNFGG